MFTARPASTPSGAPGGLAPEDAALTAAVLTLALTGDFSDLERRIISLFRDQYPRLSPLDEATFLSKLDSAVLRVQSGNLTANAAGFVSGALIPALPTPDDRLGTYRLVFALAMADLNLNQAETNFLQTLRQYSGIDGTQFDTSEQTVLTEFQPLHRAIAAAALGLMVVTADGKAEESELQDMRNSRSLLEPLGQLDDTQFQLIWDLSLVVHDRFLLDLAARTDFVTNVVANLLSSREVRYQAFRYAASVATADGDIAQSELDMLKEVLHALGMRDEVGDKLFEEFMARVVTIDGQPRPQ
ncbi:MAG: tellurite resistance TerB family protein [Anaerolineae bacterium]|nr:TerB family tellurite resistance protein [Anaerolineae bacterium]